MKMHVNWKILAALGAAGVGLVYLVAPNLVAAALPIVLLAVCPLSMLLMMKGMQGSQGEAHGQQQTAQEESSVGLTHEEQITRLRSQQAALADRINALEQAKPWLNGSQHRTTDTKRGDLRDG
jgi:hypothetical protein